MPQLQLNFLGNFQVLLDEHPQTAFESDKVRALLAYLAVESDREHSRSHLATLLWSGYSDESARTTLRHTLHQLRLSIGDESASPSILLITRQSLRFNPAFAESVDATQVMSVLHFCATHPHPHQQLAACEACLTRMKSAVDLYRGDFLADLAIPDSAPFEEWRRMKQEQFHILTLDALYQLSDVSESRGNDAQTIHFAQRQLVLEPWREGAHRQLMRAFARQGQRSSAISQYQTCRRILAEELNIEPSAETTKLYEAIRSGEFEKQARQGAGTLGVKTRRQGDKETDLLDHPVAFTSASSAEPSSSHPVTQSPSHLVIVSPPPHNLPTQLTPLVGRDHELNELVTRLDHPETRLLTLVGAGGMGKSRLALAIAHARKEKYAGGVYLVTLAPLSNASEIAPAIANALSIELRADEPIQALIHYLRNKEMLLVFDNFEHLLEGAQLVLTLLQSAAKLRVLITSRQRLNIRGEYLYPVETLDISGLKNSSPDQVPAAVQLFTQCAQRVKADFEVTQHNLATLVRIARLVQGMPLGLELAAAWVEMLSLDEIANEIERGAEFLSADWADMPDRQRSVGAVFEWSWRLLTEGEQQVFRKLSVFRGGFTREAAEQVAGASLRVLVSLVHKSLLRAPEMNSGQRGRYEIHELLRQFATRHLTAQESERQNVEVQHSQYYLSWVQGRETQLMRSESHSAAEEIQSELDNIRLAWMWAVHNQQAALLDRSAVALWQYYSVAGPLFEGERIFSQAVESLHTHKIGEQDHSPETLTLHFTLSKLLAIHASFLIFLGKSERAMTSAQRAIVLAKSSGSDEGLLLGMLATGQIAYFTGKKEEMHDCMRQMLTLAAEQLQLGHISEARYHAQVSAYLWLGGSNVAQGLFAEARQYLLQGLQICQRLGKRRGEMDFLVNLANSSRHISDIASATREYEQAIQIANQIGYRWGAGIAQLELGEIMMLQGRYTSAGELLEAALSIFRQIGDLPREAFALSWLSQLSIMLGNYPKATDWLTEFSRLDPELDSLEVKRNGLLQRSLLAFHKSALVDALNLIDQASEIAQQSSSQHDYVVIKTLAGHIYFNLKEIAQASTLFQSALELMGASGVVDSSDEPRAGLLQIALAAGNLEQAKEYIEQIMRNPTAQLRLGIVQPFYAYWITYRALFAMDDPRALTFLESAHSHLQSCAAQIADPRDRRCFLENIAIHRSLQSAYAAIKG